MSSVTIKTQMPRDGRQPVEVPLYPDAYDLHLLLADRPDGEGRALDKQGVNLTAFADINYATLNRDIRLSTAAGLSARFPLISPAGKIYNENKRLVGQLVDGGYYENFGAATAIDIAEQLKAAGLDPFIIEITNDPELIGAVELVTSGKAEDGELCPFLARDPICNEPPVVAATNDYFFSDIRGPLRAFYGSRSAHGAHALWEAANFGGAERSGCRADGDRNNPSFMHLFLSPQYTYSKKTGTCIRADVPMSWWLSKPVQAHLASEIPQWQLDKIANLMRIWD